MIESKKKITAPKTYDPGKGRPKEHLAYLNRDEMAALKRMNGNNQERGPKGLPSFPPGDAIGSSSKASSTTSKSPSSATASVSRTSQNQASSKPSSTTSKSPSSATASVSRTSQNQASSKPSSSPSAGGGNKGGGGPSTSLNAPNRTAPSKASTPTGGGGGGARDSGQATARQSNPMASQGSSFSTKNAAQNFNNRVTGSVLTGNNPSGSLKPFDAPSRGGITGIASANPANAFGPRQGTEAFGPRAGNPQLGIAPTAGLGAYIQQPKDQARVPGYQDLGIAGVPGAMPRSMSLAAGTPVNPYAGMTRPALPSAGPAVYDQPSAPGGGYGNFNVDNQQLAIDRGLLGSQRLAEEQRMNLAAGANSPFADPTVGAYNVNKTIRDRVLPDNLSVGPGPYDRQYTTPDDRVLAAIYGEDIIGVPLPTGVASTSNVPVPRGPIAPGVPQPTGQTTPTVADLMERYAAPGPIAVSPDGRKLYSDRVPSTYFTDIGSYAPTAPAPIAMDPSVAGRLQQADANYRTIVGPGLGGVVQRQYVDPDVPRSPTLGDRLAGAAGAAYDYVTGMFPSEPSLGTMIQSYPGMQYTEEASPPPAVQQSFENLSVQPAPYTNLLDKTNLGQTRGLTAPPASNVVSNNTVADIMARYETPVANETVATINRPAAIVGPSALAQPRLEDTTRGYVFNQPESAYSVFNDYGDLTGSISYADMQQIEPAYPTAPQTAAVNPSIFQFSSPNMVGPEMQLRIQDAYNSLARRQIAENTPAPRQEIDVYPDDNVDLDAYDPDAPPTNQYVPPVVPGQENLTSPEERRLAYLRGLTSGNQGGGQQYVVPTAGPPPVVPPPVDGGTGGGGGNNGLDWFNLTRVNPPYQTMVPTPLLQTAPVSMGVGTLLPNIYVVDPFAPR